MKKAHHFRPKHTKPPHTIVAMTNNEPTTTDSLPYSGWQSQPRREGGYSHFFSLYVGLGPASTVYPKNIRNIKRPIKIFENFATPPKKKKNPDSV